MQYVRLGRSGLQVSRLVLGCMSFGEPDRGADSWTLSERDSQTIITRAADAGVNTFDTANVYSDGSSEEILGRAVRELRARDEIVVATKVFGAMSDAPNAGGLSRKAVFGAIDGSLRRLGLDHVDLYQLHRWDPDVPVEETLDALHDLVRVGKVRYVGASSMWAWQFAKAIHTARALGAPRFASMQNYYNLMYREEEREMLPLCADEGVGVLVWSPLARGRLARDWDAGSARTSDDAFGAGLYSATEVPDRAVARAVAQVAAARGVPMSVVALAWLLRNPTVTAPILGVTRPEQLEQALPALEITLSDDEVAILEQPYVPHGVVAID